MTSSDTFQMDESRAEYWKSLGINTKVGWW